MDIAALQRSRLSSAVFAVIIVSLRTQACYADEQTPDRVVEALASGVISPLKLRLVNANDEPLKSASVLPVCRKSSCLITNEPIKTDEEGRCKLPPSPDGPYQDGA